MGGTALKRWKLEIYELKFTNDRGMSRWKYRIVAPNGTVVAKSVREYATAYGAVRAARGLVAADFDLDDIKVVKS